MPHKNGLSRPVWIACSYNPFFLSTSAVSKTYLSFSFCHFYVSWAHMITTRKIVVKSQGTNCKNSDYFQILHWILENLFLKSKDSRENIRHKNEVFKSFWSKVIRTREVMESCYLKKWWKPEKKKENSIN